MSKVGTKELKEEKKEGIIETYSYILIDILKTYSLYLKFKSNWTSCIFFSRRHAGCTYQGETSAGKEHLEAAVDEEGHEVPQAEVAHVLEGQLEDVAPAHAAQVDLLRGPVRGAAQAQHLRTRAVSRRGSQALDSLAPGLAPGPQPRLSAPPLALDTPTDLGLASQLRLQAKATP